ncbi:hypothetical protein ABT039_22650 [Streptomyces lasiicapitis]|uniref:hypothetical protein n=1 Tax=Streptomyces lasiicapitis TaxID=1923961 RepID=UPI003317DD96
MNVVTMTGLALIVCSIAALLTGRLAPHRVFGLQALGYLLIASAAAAAGDISGCTICACLGLGCAWVWWKNGGDDDTKRGRRRLRRAFTPVRRTAPASA